MLYLSDAPHGLAAPAADVAHWALPPAHRLAEMGGVEAGDAEAAAAVSDCV